MPDDEAGAAAAAGDADAEADAACEAHVLCARDCWAAAASSAGESICGEAAAAPDHEPDPDPEPAAEELPALTCARSAAASRFAIADICRFSEYTSSTAVKAASLSSARLCAFCIEETPEPLAERRSEERSSGDPEAAEETCCCGCFCSLASFGTAGRC
jgi:hypothetical protein